VKGITVAGMVNKWNMPAARHCDLWK